MSNYMVTVVRNGSEVDCESTGRNAPAGSSPVFHPKCPSDVKTKQVEYPVLETGVLRVQISPWVQMSVIMDKID